MSAKLDVSIHCDRCGCHTGGYSSVEAARADLAKHGWLVTSHPVGLLLEIEDVCPTCTGRDAVAKEVSP